MDDIKPPQSSKPNSVPPNLPTGNPPASPSIPSSGPRGSGQIPQPPKPAAPSPMGPTPVSGTTLPIRPPLPPQPPVTPRPPFSAVPPKPTTPPSITSAPKPVAPPNPIPRPVTSPTPTPTPKPVAPVVPPITPSKPPVPASDLSIKSSIRTMQDDLAAIQKGQSPTGVSLEKKSEPSIPIVPPVVPKPPTPPVQPKIEVDLGKTHTSRPLNQTAPTVPTPPAPPSKPSVVMPKTTPSTPSGIAVPQSSSISRRNIRLLILGAIIVLGTAGALFYLRNTEEEITPTPTPVVITPTPTPLGLESIFGNNIGYIHFLSGSNGYDAVNSTKQNVRPGELSFYRVNYDHGNGEPPINLSFADFLSRLLIAHPTEIDSINNNQSLLLGISGALPGVNNKSAVAIITTIPNNEVVKAGMTKWEASIPEDLKALFGINPTQKSSPTFSDNVYKGVAIRYMNFPNADSTIDYAIVSPSAGLNVLIITSSKNLIYSIIDLVSSSR